MEIVKDINWFIEPDQFMMVVFRDPPDSRYVYNSEITPYKTVDDAVTWISKFHDHNSIESIWRVDMLERTLEDITHIIAHHWVELHDKRVRKDVPDFVRDSDVWEEYEAYLDARMGDIE